MVDMVDYLRWRYRWSGRLLHAVMVGAARAVCGAGGGSDPYDWLGTGCQAEYERAEQLPQCSRCLAIVAEWDEGERGGVV